MHRSGMLTRTVIGKLLGPYQIVAKLGEGGMGDVYKALDTRLDRTVAIKIVRTDFSERFEREARAISALNHPHICTLHDVGKHEGVAFLVMEFVEGAPIAGPMPLADVVRYGIQICDALEAAHKKAIVHRDLKPANIMATKAGIKLLDFGLAKLQPAAASSAGTEATVAALTGAHTVVGTPQYMAPEQIEGREADARTDIFALGCVLYELITGKRAFDGRTPSSVMAAVLATEPRKISELVPMTPATLEWIVLRCLEKDPDARWQSARDVALQLRWVGDHPEQAPKTAARRRALAPALIGGLALGIAAAAITPALWKTGPASAPVSLSMPLPADSSLKLAGLSSSIALSPDGRTVAFAAVTASAAAIYLRPLGSFEAVKVAGTEGGGGPIFSPDGRWIAFGANGQLKKIPVGGGAPVRICDAPDLRGAVWLEDDTIVLSPGATGALFRVSSDGNSPPTPLTRLDEARQEKTHRTPIRLPGGKAIVFIAGSNEIGTYDEAHIVALTLATGEITDLVKGGYAPAYSPTGHLLYVDKASVFAVSFDPATLKTSGSPVQVIKDVASLPNYGIAQYDIAPSGTLIFAPGGDRTERNQIHLIDSKGVSRILPAEVKQYFSVEISHDRRRLAVAAGGANNVLHAYDIARNQPTRLTFRLDVEGGVWTHDDAAVTYWSGTDVRSVAADGSGKEVVLIPAPVAAGRQLYPESWSADGQLLSLTIATPGKGDDVAIYSVRDKQIQEVVSSRFNEFGGHLSPDGKWIAFAVAESGPPRVYVQAVAGSGGKYPVSSEVSDLIRWTSSGRELVYAGQAGPMVVSFKPGPTPVLGKPAPLPGLTASRLANIRYGSVAWDARQFALVTAIPDPPINEIRVATNWAPPR